MRPNRKREIGFLHSICRLMCSSARRHSGRACSLGWTLAWIAIPACQPAAVPVAPSPRAPPVAESAQPPPALSLSAPSPVSSAPAPAPLPEAIVQAAEKITLIANGHPVAWDRLATMTDTFGPRLSGSRALEQAIDWMMDLMRKDGLENVRREKVMVTHWMRGKERAKIVTPVERDLVLLGLGGTIGTDGHVLRGEVAVVHELDEIKGRGAALKNKIVLIDKVMPPYDNERHRSGYGDTVRIRGAGAIEGGRVGAKAVLIRSITARSLRTPHTGMMRYAEGVPKIPAAALAIEDTELIGRLAARGKVVAEIELGGKRLPDAESANAMGELRGRELPDEIVLVGAHSDSWDVGDGSSDNGSGCLMVIEAARMLKQLGLVPRRTIRFVLFTDEENGSRGGIAYGAAHGKERHVAAIEADAGAGEPKGFSLEGKPEQIAELQRFAPLFRGIGADTISQGYSGSDIYPVVESGVLGVGLWPDTSAYFDTHHSPADTVDKIRPDYLQRNAGALALMALVLAER